MRTNCFTSPIYPASAPYGAAAAEVIAALGLTETLTGRLARSQNVGGVHAAVRSGAARYGFVALSAVRGPRRSDADRHADRYWVVPADLHTALRQDAVLLARSAGSVAARAFLDFLVGETARAIIQHHGYDLAPAATPDAGSD